MTVGELIRILGDFADDTEVCMVDGLPVVSVCYDMTGGKTVYLSDKDE